MNKPSLLSRLYGAALLASACLLLPSTMGLADINTNNASNTSTKVNCRTTPNPDKCFQQQSQATFMPADPRGLPLTNHVLWSVPLSAEMKFDSDLGWILGLGYVHMFSESMGIATKLSLGANERRGNITAGYGLTKDQQIKLTYEYLTQNLPYNFASGAINQWVDQHAIGAAYQYVIRHEILHSLEISGTYIAASSKELPDIVFYQGNDAYLNQRRIAGGQENTVLTSINLFPFASKNITLTLGGGYSQVDYDTQYESNPGGGSLAYKGELTHLLTPKTKISTMVNATAASREHAVQLSQLFSNNLELSLKGQYVTGQAGLSNSSSILLGISYPAPKNYALSNFSEVQELKNWIEKPVVYASRVLAIKEETVKKYAPITSQTIPDQNKQAGQIIDPVNTQPYFTVADPSMYESLKFSVQTAKTSDTAENTQDQDYTAALNLTLTQHDTTATLSSTSALPDLQGTYLVTITLTGMKTGLIQPMTSSSSFKLAVQTKNGPEWIKTLPPATYGTVHPTIDLDEYVITPNGTSKKSKTNAANEDTYIFTLDNPSEVPWLTVRGNELVGTNIIPDNHPSPAIVKLTAKSNITGMSTPETFEVTLNEGEAPIWNGNTALTPTANYGGAYQSDSLVNYLQSGSGNYNFRIVNQSTGDMLQLSTDGKFLVANNIDAQAPEDYQVTVEATDANTKGVKEQLLHLTINKGTEPTWNNNTLTTSAVYGSNYTSEPLINHLNAGDYDFRIVSQNTGDMLQLSTDGKFLVANNIDAQAPEDYQVTVEATDANTKGVKEQLLHLTIDKGSSPVWNEDTTLTSTATYGSPYQSDSLTNYLKDGDNSNYSFEIVTQSTIGMLTLGADKQSLTTTNKIDAEAPANYEVKVRAENNDTHGASEETLTLTINRGAAPLWISSTLTPNAFYNSNYQSDSLTNYLQDKTSNYHFEIVTQDIEDANSLLTLKDDQFLTAAYIAPDEPNNYHITVKAINSETLGETDQILTLSTSLGTAPTWTNTSDHLADAIYQNSTYQVELADYLASSGSPTGNVSFKLDTSESTTLPTGLSLNTQTGEITGEPTDLNEVGTTFKIYVIATNATNQLDSDSHEINITVTPNSTLAVPAWTGQFPDGTTGSHYSVNLANFVSSTNTPDIITYQVTDKSGAGTVCNNLNFDGNNMIAGAPGANDDGSCTPTITVTSKASGHTLTVEDKAIKILLVPTWDNNTTRSIKFSTTGDGGNLGNVTDGIDLRTYIVNGDKIGNNLRFAWTTSATEPYQIKQQGSDYYLLTTPINGHIDATHVGTSPEVNITAYNDDPNNLSSESSAFSITIDADPDNVDLTWDTTRCSLEIPTYQPNSVTRNYNLFDCLDEFVKGTNMPIADKLTNESVSSTLTSTGAGTITMGNVSNQSPTMDIVTSSIGMGSTYPLDISLDSVAAGGQKNINAGNITIPSLSVQNPRNYQLSIDPELMYVSVVVNDLLPSTMYTLSNFSSQNIMNSSWYACSGAITSSSGFRSVVNNRSVCMPINSTSQLLFQTPPTTSDDNKVSLVWPSGSIGAVFGFNLTRS